MAKRKILWIGGFVLLLLGICTLGVFYSNAEKENVIGENKKKLDMTTEKQETEKEGLLYSYKKNDDETWSANGRTYQRKVVLTGILPGSMETTTYVVLTNNVEITFEEVSKSFYSSNSADFLNPKIACVVQCYNESM